MKTIVMLLLLVCLQTSTPPKDITGKWQVDKVDISGLHMKMSEQEKIVMIKSLKTILLNTVFDFNSNHHFYLKPEIKTIPNGIWEYNAEQGVIRIKEVNNAGTIIPIKVVKKDGNTLFEMVETDVVLKVSRKAR
jgi:hypothetical protein